MPKISIVTPTYNAEKDIEACLLSVASQTYQNREHLILDGLSTDRTVEIVTGYAEKYPHIKLVSGKDSGIYDAMNKGIELATGEWLHFLGCDDVFFDNSVIESIFAGSVIDSYDFVYGNVLWGDTGTLYDGKFSLLKLMEKNICHQSIFYKRELFDKLGRYDTSYATWADWIFNIKCFSSYGVRTRYVDTVVAKFALGGHSSQRVVDDAFLKDRETLFRTYFPEEYIQINERLCSLESELAGKRHLIHEQINQLAEKDASIVDLNNRVDALKNRIDALLNSYSWKVTRPVRALADMIASRRNR